MKVTVKLALGLALLAGGLHIARGADHAVYFYRHNQTRIDYTFDSAALAKLQPVDILKSGFPALSGSSIQTARRHLISTKSLPSNLGVTSVQFNFSTNPFSDTTGILQLNFGYFIIEFHGTDPDHPLGWRRDLRVIVLPDGTIAKESVRRGGSIDQ
jgi:hypothetical protein